MTINFPALAEVIIEAVVQYYSLPNLIISDWGSVFTSKFWLLLYYFFEIKQRVFTAFHLKLMAKLKGITALSRPISEPSSSSNKKIGSDSYL